MFKSSRFNCMFLSNKSTVQILTLDIVRSRGESDLNDKKNSHEVHLKSTSNIADFRENCNEICIWNIILI